MPCEGEELSFVILLPKKGRFQEFTADLSAERLDGILEELETATLRLTLPKFEIETRAALKPALQDMGVERLFSAGAADLSGMFGPPAVASDGGSTLASTGCWVDDVHHGGSLRVDERGLEAAAGTAAVTVAGEGDSVRVDRPFVWAVRDVSTGSLLFLGQVVDPR